MTISSFNSPILVQSIESVAIKLRDICNDKNVKIMGITNEQYTRELGRVESSDKFVPYWYVKPVSVQQDATYNSFVLSNKGYETRIINGTIYKFKLIPIKVTLQCKYFTQSTVKVMEIIQNLCFNKRRASFKLESDGGFDVDIWTEVSGDFDFPEKEMASGNSYVLTSSIILHTYAGKVFRYVPVKSINVNLHTSMSIPSDEFKEEDGEALVNFVIKEYDDVGIKQGCGDRK